MFDNIRDYNELQRDLQADFNAVQQEEQREDFARFGDNE